MSLRLKKIENIRGSSLPVVLLFAAVGMITVLTYLLNQTSLAKPALSSPSSVQALLNARSGIYKAYQKMIDTSQTDIIDTLETISTLDSLFGSDLIEITDTTDDIFGPDPEPITIFSSDSFGTCEVSMLTQGSFFILNSVGKVNRAQRLVTAKLGSKIPALPDTVLLYYENSPWEGSKPDGEIALLPTPPSDSTTSLLSRMLSDYQEKLLVDDSVMFDQPLTIQSQREMDKIKDTINGHLIIDGSHFELSMKGYRTITVLGDIQITGEVFLDELSLIAGGEIKLFDQCQLRNVSLFSNSRIFIGDYASYNGDALACHSISIYGNATVKDKSTIVVCGKSSGISSSSDSLQYSIIIADNAYVDATCMALRTPGSIKTEHNTVITGILWARNVVCHRGRMQGLISAFRVIDCDDPGQLAPLSTAPKDSSGGNIIHKSAVPGELSPLANISDYPMPFFTGFPSIIDWKEY